MNGKKRECTYLILGRRRTAIECGRRCRLGVVERGQLEMSVDGDRLRSETRLEIEWSHLMIGCQKHLDGPNQRVHESATDCE